MKKSSLHSQIYRRVLWATVISSIILFTAGLIGLLFAHRIVRPIEQIAEEQNNSAESVSRASEQLASSSSSLSEGASQQVVFQEETFSALEQMVAMTGINANNADKADNLMKEAGNLISRTNETMTAVSVSMKKIADYNGFRGGCNFRAVSHTKAQRTQRKSGRIYARLPDRKARNGQNGRYPAQ